jgi:hypothetical protein
MDKELDLNLSDTEIKEASKSSDFSSIGDVTIPQTTQYIKFSTDELVSKLSPFNQKKTSARDIITRSLLIDTSEPGVVTFKSSDGISFLSTQIQAEVNNFPKTCIIDIESFFNIVRSHSKQSYLICRDGKFYTNFYGGELFIQSYTLNPNIFSKDCGKIIKTGDIDVTSFLDVIKSFTPVITSSDIPELSYIFIEQDGIYASNGVLVAKGTSVLPKSVIRHSDLNLITFMLTASKNGKSSLNECATYIQITCDSFTYSFPKVSTTISASYRNVFESTSGKFFINLPYITSVLTVLTGMPDGAGVVGLKFTEKGIEGIAKTRKGDSSTFKVANSGEGSLEFGEVNISLKALNVAFRVFKGESSISIAMKNERIMIESKTKQVVILLKK